MSWPRTPARSKSRIGRSCSGCSAPSCGTGLSWMPRAPSPARGPSSAPSCRGHLPSAGAGGTWVRSGRKAGAG
eukprot:2649237-Alexandrium_andersonii.AAC.1